MMPIVARSTIVEVCQESELEMESSRYYRKVRENNYLWSVCIHGAKCVVGTVPFMEDSYCDP